MERLVVDSLTLAQQKIKQDPVKTS
jgi:hypothetical protein